MLPDKSFFDLGGRGLRVLVEGGPHGDDEARRAEAALLGVVVGERRRHRVELAVHVKRLGRLYRLALGFEREHAAGIDRLAVEHHGAGAAGAAIADALAAGDIEVIPKGVEQGDPRLHGRGVRRAIDRQLEPHGPGSHTRRRTFLLTCLAECAQRRLGQRRGRGGDARALEEGTARQAGSVFVVALGMIHCWGPSDDVG